MEKCINLSQPQGRPIVSDLQKLRKKKTELVFRKGDKGSTFIILSRAVYVMEVTQQLKDK